MNLYGKNYSTKELRKRVGNFDQIAGIRLVQLDDGRGRPARAAIVHTGSGFEFTVLIDRALDIAAASHAGRAIGWRCVTGDVAPPYYEAGGIRWLRSYFGGLLTTCGLTNVGAPAPDSAFSGNGLHGRVSNIPAGDVSVTQAWQGDDYVLSVSGTMREAVLFGENLTLRRTVSTKLGENRFWIHDVVTNEGFRKSPLMLLYHCNFGWPVVDHGSQVLTPSRYVAPRDDEARDGVRQWMQCDAPTPGYREKVYFHDMAAGRNGRVTVAIVNDGFAQGDNGFGAYLSYNKRELPRFTQWKQMGEQDYVVGLEPCNCGVEGRATDERHKLLEYLRPGERREVHLEFGAITDRQTVRGLKRASRQAHTQIVDSYLDFVKKR